MNKNEVCLKFIHTSDLYVDFLTKTITLKKIQGTSQHYKLKRGLQIIYNFNMSITKIKYLIFRSEILSKNILPL